MCLSVCVRACVRTRVHRKDLPRFVQTCACLWRVQLYKSTTSDFGAL